MLRLIVPGVGKSSPRSPPLVDFPEKAKMGDEERRLLYVAVTRAKLELDVTAVEFFNPAEEPAVEEETAAPAGA